MKRVFFILLAICLMGVGCEKKIKEPQIQSGTLVDTTKPKYDIFENHNILACEVNDPLRNMEWIRELCDSLKETQRFSSVQINLYKVNGTDENLFQIGTSYSNFDYSPFLYTVVWKNCEGNLIFGMNSGTPPVPEIVEEFMADKELVAELFHFVKQ